MFCKDYYYYEPEVTLDCRKLSSKWDIVYARVTAKLYVITRSQKAIDSEPLSYEVSEPVIYVGNGSLFEQKAFIDIISNKNLPTFMSITFIQLQ